ncbi:MAG: putative Bug-like extra-cytoplasmic solute receptor, TTT-family, partial [Ramlibacter sp.]|nr:putative Bug-like extra-cytoplasmic solute receptor, TTT-family [Ramlibacter sp.]
MFITSSLRRRAALGAMLALGVAVATGPALAADPFPSKPIQLVLPFPPGGSFDPVFRALANAASQDLGQPIVLMHKPGAGGVMGTAQLATMSEADGYTIAVMHNSVIRAPLVQKTMTWDPVRDFTYIIG